MYSYARNTDVPIDRSKQQIERLIIEKGATEFFYGRSLERGNGIGFKYKNRTIKFNVPMPDRGDFPENKTGERKWDSECRRRWRVLLLFLKAAFEMMDLGLISFEDVFLAQTCLPDSSGRQSTVSQILNPKIEKMIETGKMPQLLSGE